jgi:hypothetical protein
MRRWSSAALLLAGLAAGAAGAGELQGEGFEGRWREARAVLQRDLEALAQWCHANDLFAERKKALELLLELDPEYGDARKTLGYTLQKDGTWKAPEKPKAFRDFDKQALEEAPRRWKEATAPYLREVLVLLESGTLSADERELVARDGLRFDPDNERVHAVLGDVKSGADWVLPETLRARERREVLRGFVRAAFERAPEAQPAALLEREERIPLRFTALSAPGLRVVGTAGGEELRLAARAVLALQALLQAVFESKHALPADTTVFLLADPLHAAAFVENHPDIPLAQREYFRALEGGGVQGTNDFAWWGGDSQRRIDGIVRLALGYWLSGAYQVTVDQGWAYEGLGLYLTRALVRSRMTFLAQPSRVLDPAADMKLRQRLLDPETNWVDEALVLLRERRQPPLGELFKKGASQLTTEEVLLSYTLATYLLEARPEVVAGLLARLGRGYGRAQAFQEALGMDLAAFERHLLRWLTERT